MEMMFLFAKAPDGSHPPPAAITWSGLDEPCANAKELGSAAMVANPSIASSAGCAPRKSLE